MSLRGRVGIFSGRFQLMSARDATALLADVEQCGYDMVSIPESGGKEALTHAAILLAGTKRMKVGTGIASIWGRDAMAMINGQRTLIEAYPGRFILGIGVGHRPSTALRGHDFKSPLQNMRRYLEEMREARYRGPNVPAPIETVLAALGPKMLALAREYGCGSQPYCVTTMHTKMAREALGPKLLLQPIVDAVLTTDWEVASRIAREHLRVYLALDNYRRNLLRLGWKESDLKASGSDELVNALVAWGDAGAIRRRVEEHLDAGADRVLMQVLGPEHGHSAWAYQALDDPRFENWTPASEQPFPIEGYRTLSREMKLTRVMDN